MFAWLHPGPKLPTPIHQAFSADKLLAAYRLEGDDDAWLVAAKSGLVRVASDGTKTPLCAWDEVERAAWDGQERKFTINPINASPTQCVLAKPTDKGERERLDQLARTLRQQVERAIVVRRDNVPLGGGALATITIRRRSDDSLYCLSLIEADAALNEEQLAALKQAETQTKLSVGLTTQED